MNSKLLAMNALNLHFKSSNYYLFRSASLTVILLLIYISVFAQKDTVLISDWLILSPKELSYPAFSDIKNTTGNTFSDTDLLDFDEFNFNDHFPQQGLLFTSQKGKKYTWELFASGDDGFITPGKSEDKPQVAYLACYVLADQWLSGTFTIESTSLVKAWLNGEVIGSVKKTNDIEKPGKVTKSVKMERRKHLLLVKVLMPPANDAEWKIRATLEIDNPTSSNDVEITTDPVDRKNIYHIMDGEKTNSVSLSHDGKYYAVSYRRSLPPSDDSESWTEIKRTSDKKLVRSFRHSSVSQIRWLPNSNRISYLTTRSKKSELYVLDPEKGDISAIFNEMQDVASYSWSPDESFVIFSRREQPEKDGSVMTHLLGMNDRQPGWRNRTFLYHCDVESGRIKRLTWGNLTSYLMDISPDGRKILIGQSYPDYSERPFSRQNLYLMDLNSMTLDTVWNGEKWGISASFSPDGKYLLATAGPWAFDGIGMNVSEGKIAINHDRQVFLYRLDTKEATPITKDFNPTVRSAYWHKSLNKIYLHVTEEDFARLYSYDPVKNRFQLIETGVDMVSSIDFASNGQLAVFSGNLSNRFSAFYLTDLSKGSISELENTEGHNYRHVEFGELSDWNFTTAADTEIKGRVYYPPHFDPERKYPVIVYYYAGINPVGRTFGGRYPFNLWAGNGYLVYVLQPSGAIGFGQDFSAEHVNNWGTTVAGEIIEGVTKFLDAHPYADREKVGCAGASYGGFMTMLLLTQTDIFATAISHAGISSISSYWGEGYWGYGYSAEASANSYPWNNHELYIGQSPLFYADRITTPLLLLTGDSDTNVPPGESIQMYTALKLLGRPVELIMVKGEDHHILTYNKRIEWHRTIMAWWDKYLKDQKSWWEELFPEKNY
jgi:dipeptidyl aminopeptidase/acylaminoacyl peptidase